MNPMRHGLITLLVSVAFVTFSGCGENAPSVVKDTTTEANVKGTVKLNGKAATGGSVVFDPANAERKNVSPRTAPIGEDGTYQIKTLVGTNRVSLTGPAILKVMPRAQFKKLEYEVKAGDNNFDIELSDAK